MKNHRNAAWREPGGTCGAVGVAIIKGGAIRPDVLPASRYTARASNGDRGRGGVFPEETGVSGMVPESVRPSKEGLRGVKQADAAQSIGHSWPNANARAYQRGVRPPLAVAPLGDREGFNNRLAGGGEGLGPCSLKGRRV